MSTRLLLTEDLTPHKIALLFLIDVYVQNEVIAARSGPFLSFLVGLLSGESMYDSEDELIVVPSLKYLCFGIEKVIGDDVSIQKSLLASLWSVGSVSELDSKLSQIYNCIAGPNFIYADTGKVSSRSLFGMFIYKVVTSVRLLKFDEVFLLFTSFVEYRETVRDLFQQFGGEIAQKMESDDEALFKQLNGQLSEITGSSTDSTNNASLLPVSKNDLQILLDKQISVLESFGTPTPSHLRDVMYLMTTSTSMYSIQNINFNNLPSYYYIRYLENLHQSNYNGAFESLHQYFDYMVSNNSKYFYHFALISKASLHQFFGEDEKAIDSIEEAISVARENKDNATLTFILSWLFNFIRNKPELWHLQSFSGTSNTEDQLLDFLIQKSQSVSLSLYSSSYNFKTLQLINNGGSDYFETLLKATFISLHDSNVSSFIKSAEIQSVVWNGIGVPLLRDVYHEIAVELADKPMDKFLIKLRNLSRPYVVEKLSKLQMDHSVILQNNNSIFGSFQVCSMINSVRQNMNSGQYNVSAQLINSLLSAEIRELDSKNEVVCLHVENEMYLQNYSFATTLIEKYLSGGNLTLQGLRLNLLKCRIYLATQNCKKGLVKLVKIIETAKMMKYTEVVLEGTLVFVGLVNETNTDADETNELIRQVMPSVLSLDIDDLTADFYFELGRGGEKKHLIKSMEKYKKMQRWKDVVTCENLLGINSKRKSAGSNWL